MRRTEDEEGEGRGRGTPSIAHPAPACVPWLLGGTTCRNRWHTSSPARLSTWPFHPLQHPYPPPPKDIPHLQAFAHAVPSTWRAHP